MFSIDAFHMLGRTLLGLPHSIEVPFPFSWFSLFEVRLRVVSYSSGARTVAGCRRAARRVGMSTGPHRYTLALRYSAHTTRSLYQSRLLLSYIESHVNHSAFVQSASRIIPDPVAKHPQGAVGRWRV